MCQSFFLIFLGLAVTLVQGIFLFAEKKENLVCNKVCPLYCKDHYKKESQRRWDYDISTRSYVDVSARKSDNENYRDTYNFYFGPTSKATSTTSTSKTTEEPTLISPAHHRSLSDSQDRHPDFPSYPFKELPPDFGEIEDEYFYPYPAPYYYNHPHFIQETTTPSTTTTTTEEPTFICMVCLRKCPPG